MDAVVVVAASECCVFMNGPRLEGAAVTGMIQCTLAIRDTVGVAIWRRTLSNQADPLVVGRLIC